MFDLGLVMASFGLTEIIVYSHRGSLAQFLSIRIKLSNFAILSLAVLAWHFVFYLCGMYGSKRLSTRLSEVVDALKATTLCAICLALLTQLFTIVMVTPRFCGLFW